VEIANLSTLSLAQMDFGDLIDQLCPLLGFALLAGLGICVFAAILVKRKHGSHHKFFFIIIPALVIFAILFALWIPLAYHNKYYEPHITEVGADLMVENLPEVQHYLDAGNNSTNPRGIQEIGENSRVAGLPYYSVEFLVGDSDRTNMHVTKTWHTFGVDLINGQIWILVHGNRTRIGDWRNSKQSPS
jgi:hypothetical protein